MIEKYVSTRGNGSRDYCGVANVIVPKEKDQAQYVESCYRRGMVSIQLENGGRVDNVIVSKAALRDIEFPVDYKSLGSQVVWVNKPRQNQPIIVGVFDKSNDFISVNDDKASIGKRGAGGVYETTFNKQSGVVIISSSSTSDLGGDIYIISTNKQKSSKLSVSVSGSIAIETPELSLTSSKRLSLVIKDSSVDDNKTSITYEKGVGLTYKDEFNNQVVISKDSIQLKPVSKLSVGDGAEPMVLGTTLNTALKTEQLALTALLNAIKAAPVTAGDGGAAFKASLVAAISALQRGDYSGILSKVATLD